MRKKHLYFSAAVLLAVTAALMVLVFGVISPKRGDLTGHEAVVSALTAEAEQTASEAESYEVAEASDGTSEGIKVHGHWTIEVRDPDGTLVSKREFENALNANGIFLFSYLLTRNRTVGTFQVELDSNNVYEKPCIDQNKNRIHCLLCESTYSAPDQPFIFKTLVVTRASSPSAVVLTGSATAAFDSVIKDVNTYLRFCSSSVTPDDCFGSNELMSNPFTSATLGTPISVVAGQQILVTMTISFS